MLDVTITQLRMLREVVRLGTIAKAAEHLGYTPSAVSQQLSAVERSIGVAVLERVGRNVIPTDAGHELVAHGELILGQLDRAEAAIEQIQGKVAGDLRVFFFGSIGSTMLEPVMSQLNATYPDLRIRTSMEDRNPRDMLKRGDLHVAFAVARDDAPINDTDLSRMLVCRDWLKLAVPKGTLSERGPVDLNVMQDWDFIAPPAGDAYGFAVGRAFSTMSAPPVVAHQLADFPTVLRLVANGTAAALVPDLALVREPTGVDIYELKFPQHRVIDLLYRTSTEQRPAIQAFLRTVAEVADTMGLDRTE